MDDAASASLRVALAPEDIAPENIAPWKYSA
jgi:hypothetical protein